ncbi:MAG TPA: hypothetical protein VFC19_25840 [Candidatus Limnocylindrales bacterium]|nr:hypothetical protein [Candidatus Limnocylindrales bacterium]
MREESRTGLHAWVGTAAAVISALATLFAAYNWRVSASGTVGWTIICLAEAAVIGWLAIYLFRRSPVRLPRGIRAENRRILESLFRSVSKDFEDQLAELSRSQISLYGRQVRNAQVHLLEWLAREVEMPSVRATDIVRRLDLWPTRGVYRAANAKFIKDGGRISRVFLASSDLFNNDEEAAAFWSILEDHKSMGVNVTLHIIDLLAPEFAEDYVIYQKDAVLVEIEQGDVDFSRGKVTVFFDSRTIDAYTKRFQYLHMSNDTKTASEVLALFEKYFVNVSPGRPFGARKAAFMRDAR